MRKLRLLVFVLLCVLLTVPAVAQEAPVGGGGTTTNALVDTLAEMGGYVCDESDFTCVVFEVPLDHDNPDNGLTLEVTFGVLPATGTSQGLYVTATGGPGISGLSSADWYSSYFDPAIFENFDVVFFDQRGVGLSNGLDCPDASAAYYLADLYPIVEAQEQAYIEATQTFVEDCVAEMDADDLLPYLGTRQAIRDLELFRQALGSPQIWLYGESYGTQYAQEYAATFPDSLSGLILDGVVDLTLTGEDFYVQQAQAFGSTITAALTACNADAACAADFGMDAVAFYDDLAAELLSAPAVIDFPLPSGIREPRRYTLGMLETSAYNAAYERSGRSNFVRALAAAAQGDLLPLLRLGYADLGMDPQTQDLTPAYGDGAAPYYLIECSDYSFGSGTPEERAQAFLDAGDAVEAAVPRLSSVYYSDLPCVFWPAEGPAERPEAFSGGAYTTFVLNSTTDPATPTQNGYDVFSRLENAYMITQQGGPHVIFGRGETCPDVAVTDWMVYGTLPLQSEYVCAGDILAGYTPLSPSALADFEDIEALMQAIDIEIQLLPEYIMWDVYTPTLVGCPYGGVMTFSAVEDGERFAFAGCGFFSDVVLDGSGEWTYDVSFTLDVALSGAASGDVSYLRDDYLGMYSVTGTVDGEEVGMTP